MKKRHVRILFWLGVCFALGILVLVIFFYSGTPQPGTDYLAVINQPALEAADHEKGWTIYRDQWIKHGFSEGGGWQLREIHLLDKNGKRFGPLVRPGDGAAWQAAIVELVKVEDLLEGFRVGGVRPSYGLPLYIDPTQYHEADFRALFPNSDYKAILAEKQAVKNSPLGLMGLVQLPNAHRMREAFRLLTVDTRWALDQDDVERATRNIEAMLGITTQVTECKLLVPTFIGYSLHAVTLDLIDESLHSKVRFDDLHLERMHHALKKARIETMIDLSTEKALFLDFIQNTYTDDGNGDGRITSVGFAFWNAAASTDQGWSIESTLRHTFAPLSLFFMPTRRQLTEKGVDLFERANEVLKDVARDQPSVEFEELAKIESELEEFSILKAFFPQLLLTGRATINARINASGVTTALAVLRFQRQHERLPESLNELIGEFLEQIPLDPIDGQPIRYKRQDDGFVIYSVGVNRVDDGGQRALIRVDRSIVADPSPEEKTDQPRPAHPFFHNPDNEYPSDWVLWPRYIDELENAAR